MREIQRGADIGHDFHGPFMRHRALGLHDVAERPTLDVLHDDVRQRTVLGLGLAGVVHRDDRRVIQGRGVLRLPPEALLKHRVTGEVGTQDLHSHLTAEPGVVTVMDLGHTAVAECVTQFVAV